MTQDKYRNQEFRGTRIQSATFDMRTDYLRGDAVEVLAIARSTYCFEKLAGHLDERPEERLHDGVRGAHQRLEQ
jgi:hypothetical protein